MLRRIILENFMSHGRTEIDLSDGLTVLAGPNNCGKSAVVAALQILASNGRSTHVMRHGEKTCRITVETDDGHTVCWERTKSTVKYTIDGEDIHRVGTSVPDSLHDVLKLDRVKAEIGAGTHEYDIHFGEQKSPVFLLGETGSRAASFFASSSDASRLVEMQHRHRSNLRERRSAAKELTQEVEKTKTRLQRYEPMDALAERLATATAQRNSQHTAEQKTRDLSSLIERLTESSRSARLLKNQYTVLARLQTATTSPAELQQSQQTAQQLAAAIRKLKTISRRQRQFEGESKALRTLAPVPPQHEVASAARLMEDLHTTRRRKQFAARVLYCCHSAPPPPALEPVDLCRELIDRLRSAESQCTRLSATTTALASLQPTPTVHETAELGTTILKLTQADRSAKSARVLSAVVVPLQQPPEQSSVETIRRDIEALKTQERRVAKARSGSTVLSTVVPPMELTDVTPLTQIISELNDLQRAVKSAQDTVDRQDRVTKACEAELRQFVSANPVCHTCGATIDPDRLMAGIPIAHDHGTAGTTVSDDDAGDAS